MSDVEICYFRNNGRQSLIYRPNCLGPGDAKREVLQQATCKPAIDQKFAFVEIWDGLERTDTIVLRHAV